MHYLIASFLTKVCGSEIKDNVNNKNKIDYVVEGFNLDKLIHMRGEGYNKRYRKSIPNCQAHYKKVPAYSEGPIYTNEPCGSQCCEFLSFCSHTREYLWLTITNSSKKQITFRLFKSMRIKKAFRTLLIWKWIPQPDHAVVRSVSMSRDSAPKYLVCPLPGHETIFSHLLFIWKCLL